MPIAFAETKETMNLQAPAFEDPAMNQKRAHILLSETQEIVNRLSANDSQMMAQDFSICIGWRRVKICLTIE